jgi:hypothetical protein
MNFTIEGRKLKIDPIKSWLWEVIILNTKTLMASMNSSSANIKNFISALSMNEEDLINRCRSVTIPSVEIETYTSNYLGFKKVHPLKKKFSDIATCEYESFEDRKEYTFFYNWMNLIIEQNPKMINVGGTGLAIVDRSLFTRNIMIKQYKGNGDSVVNNFILYNAYPIKIADIPMSYENTTSVKFAVDFAYDNWTLE